MIDRHGDDELEALLGSQIVERLLVHEWPLSSVERLRLADGRTLAYKSQLPPTVEPSFYPAATSPLLPAHQRLGRLGESETMTLEWIDAPLLSKDDDLIGPGREVVRAIGEIQGDLPSYLDAGTTDAWLNLAEETLDRWERVIKAGWFRSTNAEDVAKVYEWAQSEPVLLTIEAGTHLTHGDLKADQIFVTPQGYRVIDWQRPVVAPPEVDLVSLLVDAGVDPRPVVDPAVIGIFWLLRLRWAVEAQDSLFPGTRFPLFDGWAAEAAANI
jgi:hypothetical protein